MVWERIRSRFIPNPSMHGHTGKQDRWRFPWYLKLPFQNSARSIHPLASHHESEWRFVELLLSANLRTPGILPRSRRYRMYCPMGTRIHRLREVCNRHPLGWNSSLPITKWLYINKTLFSSYISALLPRYIHQNTHISYRCHLKFKHIGRYREILDTKKLSEVFRYIFIHKLTFRMSLLHTS